MADPRAWIDGVDWSEEDAELMRNGAFASVNPPVINSIQQAACDNSMLQQLSSPPLMSGGRLSGPLLQMEERKALIPIPTDNERILLARLWEARREAAITRLLLASMHEREKTLAQQAEAATIRANYWESMMSDQAEIIRTLRRELIEAHDLVGRAEGVAMAKSAPVHDWTRVATGDRRMLGT